MHPPAGMADLLRTAGLPAIRVVTLSAGCAPDRVLRGVLSREAPLPVLRSPRGASIAASAVLASAYDSGPSASEAIAITTVADVLALWDIRGGMGVGTIRTGGGIPGRLTIKTSNTRRAWRTR